MAQITYEDKVALNENPQIPDINKCNADDLNEIKNVVNGNAPENTFSNEETTGTSKTYTADFINTIKENIENELYYKSGDTVTFDQSVVASVVTGGTRYLIFTLKLPKSIQNVTSATITSGGVIGRTPTGSYLDGQSSAFDITTSSFTSTITLKPNSQELYISIVKNIAFTNITNNMCLTSVLYNFTIRFS